MRTRCTERKTVFRWLCLGVLACSGLTGWGKDDDVSTEATSLGESLYWDDVEPAKRLRILMEVEPPVSEEERVLFYAAESLDIGEAEERERAWAILRESPWPDAASFWNWLLYGSYYLEAEDKLVLFTRAIEELEKRPDEERDADWYWFMSYSWMGKGLCLPRGDAIEVFSKSLEATHQAARLFQEAGRRELEEAAWRQVASLEEMFGSIYFSYDKVISERHYRKFFEAMRTLAESSGNFEDFERLREARLKWADTLWHLGETEKALGFYRMVEDELVAMVSPLESWAAIILSVSLQTVSQRHLVKLEFSEAIPLLERARSLHSALLVNSRENFPASDVFSFYAAEEALARFLTADEEGLEEHFDRVTKLLERYGSARQRRNWNGIRVVFEEIGEELKRYEANMLLREALRDRRRGDLMRRLAHELHLHEQSSAAVLAAQHEAVRILRNHPDDPLLREDYLFALAHLGQAYFASGWWKDAEETLTIFDQQARRERASFVQDSEFRLLRANGLLRLEDVRHFLHKTDSSDELIDEAVEILNALNREGFLGREGTSTLRTLQSGEWRPRLRPSWQMEADTRGRVSVGLILEQIDGRGSIGIGWTRSSH